MFAGVPLMPFVVITGAFVIVSVWTFYYLSAYLTLFLLMVYLPLLLTMRNVTRKDDQRLRQWMLRLRMRIRQRASRRMWGAYSYSPIRYKKRSTP